MNHSTFRDFLGRCYEGLRHERCPENGLWKVATAENREQKGTNGIRWKGFVSGHDFSRAARARKKFGFSRWGFGVDHAPPSVMFSAKGGPPTA